MHKHIHADHLKESKIPFLHTGIGSILGISVTILVELFMLYKKIKESKRKWDDGLLITKRTGFIKEVIDAFISFLCRSGGSIGGMVLGQFFIPIPFVGAFVGMLLGTFTGDFLSKQIPEKYLSDTASGIDEFIDELYYDIKND